MTSSVCVSKRKRRVIVHISWSQWCLRPIKFDSHQNLLCTLETCQLCTAHYRPIPTVPTKDFKPFIYAGVFVPICIPSKLYNLWDFLSDKECAPLISPRLMGSLPQFFLCSIMHICPSSWWSWLYLHRDTCSKSSFFQMSVWIISAHWLQTKHRHFLYSE